MINVEKLKTSGVFTNYIYKTIPLAFDESMSYYETLCGLLSYLTDTVIPTVDNNADALIELQNYIEHYFDNLDVQEEINNKLDEMVESSELQEIITSYLQVNGVLGYNTVNDMINATNLIEGSIAKTLGKSSFNDGEGSYYKIRNITNEDIIDNYNIIALENSDTLIAERIFTYNEIFDEYIKVNNKDEFLRLIQIPNTGIEICKEITLNESITPANNIKIKNGIINYEGDDEFVIDLTNKNLDINNVTFNI